MSLELVRNLVDYQLDLLVEIRAQFRRTSMLTALLCKEIDSAILTLEKQQAVMRAAAKG